MKIIFSSFLFLISIYLINGQDNPVKWDIIHNIEHQELEFKATIDNSWHLYAVHLPNPNEGPLPTEFNFSENEGIKIIGSISESKPTSVFDTNFGVQVSYFETKAICMSGISEYERVKYEEAWLQRTAIDLINYLKQFIMNEFEFMKDQPVEFVQAFYEDNGYVATARPDDGSTEMLSNCKFTAKYFAPAKGSGLTEQGADGALCEDDVKRAS